MENNQERTIIVGVEITRSPRNQKAAWRRFLFRSEESLDELAVLAESAGGTVVERVLQQRPALDAATLIGSGKVDEIKARVEADLIDTVIFDRELTPTQLRNLERKLGCKILDRTQLILDIFARRARTREGQLQVELAQLNYLLPRSDGARYTNVALGRRHRNQRSWRNSARDRPAKDRQADS